MKVLIRVGLLIIPSAFFTMNHGADKRRPIVEEKKGVVNIKPLPHASDSSSLSHDEQLRAKIQAKIQGRSKSPSSRNPAWKKQD